MEETFSHILEQGITQPGMCFRKVILTVESGMEQRRQILEAKAILEAIAEVLAECEQGFSAWGEAYCHCPSIYNELL